MSFVVVSLEELRVRSSFWDSSSASCVAVSPSWYMSIRGFGMGCMNGGWSLVVGMLVVGDVMCGVSSPIYCRVVMNAMWSL
jgi:hypothetical protein